jgi:hypothetical protein
MKRENVWEDTLPVHYFPFGQPLRKIKQTDRTRKQVFVLGVYASAVHAQWIDQSRKTKVRALAVASEPYIFWKGENAEDYFPKIPPALGKLTLPIPKDLNGASGKTLDDLFLSPLDFRREDAWLCDLLPESRVNPNQQKAIDREYTCEIIAQYGLKPATIPIFYGNELDSVSRRQEILEELEASCAEVLILLGDLPIRWFLRYFTNNEYVELAQFGETAETYGKSHEMKICGRSYNVISLCHPRQAARLGTSSSKWGQLHDKWIEQQRNRH